MVTQSLAQKRQETPGERADRLAQEGYHLQRTPEPGVYLIERPDRTKRYRVDTNRQQCGCQSTAWWSCRHLLYAARWASYDRAKAALMEAYRRGVLMHEHEDDLYAAGSVLMTVTGLDLWDDVQGWVRRCRRAVTAEMGRQAA